MDAKFLETVMKKYKKNKSDEIFIITDLVRRIDLNGKLCSRVGEDIVKDGTIRVPVEIIESGDKFQVPLNNLISKEDEGCHYRTIYEMEKMMKVKPISESYYTFNGCT